MFRERCSCGAEFETDHPGGMRLIREWRREHTCTEPVIDPSFVSAEAKSEIAPDNITPELHIGFRSDPYDE